MISNRLVVPWARIFAVGVVVWGFVVLVSSWNKSPAFDEVPHIAAGLTYMEYGDFRLNPEHPPLMKVLSVLPVVLLDDVPVVFETERFRVKSWFESTQDFYGYFLLFRNRGVNPRLVIFHARMVPVLVGVAGVMLAFWWGRRLGKGVAAGVASGALLMLYPEYAGHARFVTLDVPAMVGCAGVSAAGYAWWRRPGWRMAMVFSGVAAVGSLVKLPVTVFTVFVLMTLAGLGLGDRRRIGIKKYAGLVALTVFAGYVAAWVGSGFRFGLTNPELEIDARSVYAPADGNYGEGALAAVLGWLWTYRLLPEATLATLAHVRSFEGRNYYFMGEWSKQGWYSYFFVTFLLKTSLVMVAVYGAAVATWVWQLARLRGQRRQVELAKLTLLLMPFVLLFAMFVLGRASLGHRYVLFIYFPLSVLAGVAMARWWARSLTGRLVIGVVIVYNVALFAWQYPHYETYFNEVVRTPYRATKYVGDSNVDWGQDFPVLGDEMRRRGIREVNLALFGTGRPSAYGINSYKWILPGYPFATFRTEEAVTPDPQLFTAMSMHAYLSALRVLPGRYTREPVWVENSVMLFAPEAGAAASPQL